MIIKQNLIKNCRNFQAIFYLQTMLYLKPICFMLLFVFGFSLNAQDNALVIKTPQNLDDVLERKLSLDKKQLAKNQYTIQIFSGNFHNSYYVFPLSFLYLFPHNNHPNEYNLYLSFHL